MDPVTIQTLITVGSFLVLGTVYVVNTRVAAKILGARLEVIDASMEDFKVEIRRLAEVLTAQAVQSKRMDYLEERQLTQGKRLDESEKRINLYADTPIYRRERGDI